MNLTELKAKIAVRKSEIGARETIVKQPDGVTDVKATPNQEQILWKIRRDGKNSHYHFIVHFEGLLDERKLISAINRVFENQVALRTAFYESADGWRQRVVPFTEIDVEIIDLSELPEAESQRHALKLAENLAEFPISVFDGELFRLRLLRLSETHHLLVVVLAHLCCDFASLSILNREVMTNYAQPAATQSAAINYLDYCKWLENKFTAEKLAEQRAFWKNYLKTAKPLRRGENPSDAKKIVNHEFLSVPAAVGDKTESLIAEYRYSRQVVCTAVFALTLFAQTRQNPFAVGSPTSGRDKPELENLMGCFTNLLVFNIEIDAGKTFLEFLEQVRNNILQCYRQQDTPFDLIEKCAPDIFKNENISLAGTIFSVNEVERRQFDLLGLKIRMEMLETFQAVADLTFTVYFDREIFLSAEYAQSVFSREEIKKLQTDYLNLLMFFTARPEAKIAQAVAGIESSLPVMKD